MPTVGKKKFAYSAEGKKKAKEYAKKTGKKLKTKMAAPYRSSRKGY